MNMHEQKKPLLRRMWEQLIPPIPDFHGMLGRQCEILKQAVTELEDYLHNHGDPQLAEKVRHQVQVGHDLRDKNLALLTRSFITPIDREDIYTLTIAIDHILDYVKNTVRELETLRLDPDESMHKMATQLGQGAAKLAEGLALLRSDRAAEVPQVVNTRHIERQVEKLYREALGEMFEGEAYQRLAAQGDQASVVECLQFVVSRMKRREVYRHLSNAADRLAHAGESLRNISIKYE
jgi:uncharacterized protein Yka (UPF0111/DUF47 family)